jgi:hypothetical protein
MKTHKNSLRIEDIYGMMCVSQKKEDRMGELIDPIADAVSDELVLLARRIAVTHGYPVLIRGLQPLQDYEVNGVLQPGLRSKYMAEVQELRDSLSKERVWQWSKAADLLCCASAIDAQELATGIAASQHATYQDTLATLASPAYQIDQDEAEAAALAKYRLRASLPYRKDKETTDEKRARAAAENVAIQAAVDALVDPALWPGWPLPEVASLYGIPQQSLYYACEKQLIPSRRAGERLLLIDLRSPRWRQWYRKWRQSK